MDDKSKAALEAATVRLKETISEAHGVIKDIRYEQRRLQELRDQAAAAVKEIVDRRIDGQVETGLREYKAALAKAIDQATDRVYARFDGLAAILMGEDNTKNESLEALVRKWKRAGHGDV